MFKTITSIAIAVVISASGTIAVAQEPTLETNSELEITGNVYLRNYMFFTGDRSTGGASSTFIKYDGKICLLTAKHLLTGAMGIEPSVKPSNFNEELINWVVFSNPELYDIANAEPLAYVTSIVRPDDDFSDDFMLLETNGSRYLLAGMTVPVAENRPAPEDDVYVIGCPYDDKASCAQKIYSGRVTRLSGNEFFFSWDRKPNRLSGFSGGAVLNADGEIVGVVWGGSPDSGIATMLPDWLREAEEPEIKPYEFGDLPLEEAIRLQTIYEETNDMIGPYIITHGEPQQTPDLKVLNNAIGRYIELIEAVPGHWSAHSMIGKIYQAVGNNEAALEAFKIAHRINPEETGVINELTITAVELDLFDDARTLVEAELIKRPDTLSLRSRLALIDLLTGRLDEAISNADLALEISPGDQISSSIRKLATDIKNGDRKQPTSFAHL